MDGRLQSRSYEGNDGKRVYVTEVVAESVQFLEPKDNGQTRNNQSSSYTRVDDNPFQGQGETIDIKDDELPF